MHTRGGAGSHTHAPPPTNGRTCLGDGRAWAVIPSPRRLRACVMRGNETTVGRVRTSNFYRGRCASSRPTWRGTRARRQRCGLRGRGAPAARVSRCVQKTSALGRPAAAAPVAAACRRAATSGTTDGRRTCGRWRRAKAAAAPPNRRARAPLVRVPSPLGPPLGCTPPLPPLPSLFRGGCAAAGFATAPAPLRVVHVRASVGEAARGCTGGAVGDGTAQRFCL